MNPKEFIEIAKKFRDSSDEALRRTSVSRAYFGVLNILREFFSKNNVPVKKGPGVHGDIYNYLLYCNVKDLEIISNKFNSMKNCRNKADYNMRTNEFKNSYKSKKIFSNAKEIIDKFEDSDKNRLLSGVKEYLNKIPNN